MKLANLRTLLYLLALGTGAFIFVRNQHPFHAAGMQAESPRHSLSPEASDKTADLAQIDIATPASTGHTREQAESKPANRTPDLAIHLIRGPNAPFTLEVSNALTGEPLDGLEVHYWT